MTAKEAVNKVVELAKSEIGYKASYDKKTKYAEYLDGVKDYYNGPKNGFDWCDVFVDYLFAKCFGPEIGRRMIYQPLRSAGAGVGFSMDYYKNSGAFRQLPEIGSQIFFGTYHTGIVIEIDGDQIITVEGNAGGGPGEVRRKVYNRHMPSIAGYGIPKWTLAEDVKDKDNVKNEKKDDIKKKIETTCQELAKKSYDTLQGKNGNGAARVKTLGDYYTPVQWIINRVLKE